MKYKLVEYEEKINLSIEELKKYIDTIPPINKISDNKNSDTNNQELKLLPETSN